MTSSLQVWAYRGAFLERSGCDSIQIDPLAGKVRLYGVQLAVAAAVTQPPPNGIIVPAGADPIAAINAAPQGAVLVFTASQSQFYRVTQPLPLKAGSTYYSQTGATFRGSKVLTGWQTDGAGHWYVSGVLPSAYSDGGVCNVNSGTEANPCQKREDVFRDGVQLKRYMNLSSLVSGGTFADYSANRLYLADDPTGRLLEMSSTQFAVNATGNGIKVTGLRFMHYATPSQQAAVQFNNSTGVVVDLCEIFDNHAIGVRFNACTGCTVQNTKAHHNGQMAFGNNRSNSCKWLNNEFSYSNAQREYWALDWEAGGGKFATSTANLFQGNYVHHNNGVGIWFDIDNTDNVIDSNRSWDNASCGLRYEISFDVQITNNDFRRNGYGHKQSTVWRNGTDGGPFATGGINVNCSGGGYTSMNGIWVTGNRSEDDQNGIHLQNRGYGSGGVGVGDPAFGRGPSAFYGTARYWALRNCHVEDNFVIRRDFSSDTGTDGSSGIGTLSLTGDVTYHAQGNTFARNRYSFASTAKTRLQGYRTGPTQNMTFAIWQTMTGDGGLLNDIGGSVSVAARGGFRVATGADDGSWGDLPSASFSATAQTMAIGDFDSATQGKAAFIRVKVDIPRNATITSAVLDLLPRGINGAIPPVFITAEKVGNSPQPASRTDITARVSTTAQVAWTPAAWVIGSWQSTPSLIGVLQEIVNQPTWNSGQFVTFLIKPQVVGWTGVQDYITITPYDYDPNSAAGLLATWS